MALFGGVLLEVLVCSRLPGFCYLGSMLVELFIFLDIKHVFVLVGNTAVLEELHMYMTVKWVFPYVNLQV